MDAWEAASATGAWAADAATSSVQSKAKRLLAREGAVSAVSAAFKPTPMWAFCAGRGGYGCMPPHRFCSLGCSGVDSEAGLAFVFCWGRGGGVRSARGM